MTNKERAIVMAYTGVCMLTGDNLNEFYKYLEELFGSPVYTHEIPYLAETIKQKSFNDFLKLCA